MSPKRIRQFLRENGIYVFCTALLEMPATAVRNYLVSRKLGVKKLRLGPRSYLRGLSAIEMGEDCSSGEGLWLQAIFRYNEQRFEPRILIGNRVRISSWVHIAATNHVEIGDDVLMGSKVMIADHNHGQYNRTHTSPHVAPSERPLDYDRKVVIGRNVWLGDGVVVTPGSIIGDGCVIGANSVVRGVIPPLSMAAGVPAKVLKAFNLSTQKWINVE